jgi:hypothetical protein
MRNQICAVQQNAAIQHYELLCSCKKGVWSNTFQWEFPEGCGVTISTCPSLLACRVLLSMSGASGFKVSRDGEYLLLGPPPFSKDRTVCIVHFLYHNYSFGSYFCGHSELVSRNVGSAYTYNSSDHAEVPYLALDLSVAKLYNFTNKLKYVRCMREFIGILLCLTEIKLNIWLGKEFGFLFVSFPSAISNLFRKSIASWIVFILPPT